MGTRGRKSAVQLAIAPQVVEIIPRPVAPGDLTDEQADEWQAIAADGRSATRITGTCHQTALRAGTIPPPAPLRL